VSVDDLRGEWRRRARELGFGPARVEALLGRSPLRSAAEPGAVPREVVAPEVVVAALGAVGAAPATFTRRDVVRAWAGSQPQGAPAGEVERTAEAFMAHVAGPGAAGPARPGQEGRGVAEGRHVLPDELRLDVDVGPGRRLDRRQDRRQLEQLLGRRGMTLATEPSRGRETAVGIGLGW
jgi:hypothetical protein